MFHKYGHRFWPASFLYIKQRHFHSFGSFVLDFFPSSLSLSFLFSLLLWLTSQSNITHVQSLNEPCAHLNCVEDGGRASNSNDVAECVSYYQPSCHYQVNKADRSQCEWAARNWNEAATYEAAGGWMSQRWPRGSRPIELEERINAGFHFADSWWSIDLVDGFRW